MPKSPEEFWEANKKYNKQLKALRQVMLDCGLSETFKWSFPTYTHKGANLISIAGFKDYYGIWFFQGVFLSDEAKVLTNAQKGKTKAMRQWKFDTRVEIDYDLVRTYIFEAIENQKLGKVVKVTIDTSYDMPTILSDALARYTELSEKFYALTSGRQKEYANYIADAKQESTKLKRIDKIIPIVIAGKGLNDRYR